MPMWLLEDDRARLRLGLKHLNGFIQERHDGHGDSSIQPPFIHVLRDDPAMEDQQHGEQQAKPHQPEQQQQQQPNHRGDDKKRTVEDYMISGGSGTKRSMAEKEEEGASAEGPDEKK